MLFLIASAKIVFFVETTKFEMSYNVKTYENLCVLL